MSIIHSPYQIFSLERQDFLKASLDLFRYQADHCAVYKQYIQLLEVDVNEINQLEDIPFLPIQLFKTHTVLCGDIIPELYFESSATSGQVPSKHFILDKKLYNKSLLQSFESALGPTKGKVILGLLPHYLERKNSSLVYMVDYLMRESGQSENGFYLDKEEELFELILELEKQQQETVLFGVTFALLDFAKKFSAELNYTQLIETGGMKGRGQEMTRAAVHSTLQASFGSKPIYSEYGMAELLSQSYYMSHKQFVSPPWKKVLVRDVYDPLDVSLTGKGGLNMIDLANMHSCSFIATDDIGIVGENGQFDILGRLDASEIRGCNLLLES